MILVHKFWIDRNINAQLHRLKQNRDGNHRVMHNYGNYSSFTGLSSRDMTLALFGISLNIIGRCQGRDKKNGGSGYTDIPSPPSPYIELEILKAGQALNAAQG